MSRKVMQQVLDALIGNTCCDIEKEFSEEIAGLRRELAKPDEPVACSRDDITAIKNMMSKDFPSYHPYQEALTRLLLAIPPVHKPRYDSIRDFEKSTGAPVNESFKYGWDQGRLK